MESQPNAAEDSAMAMSRGRAGPACSLELECLEGRLAPAAVHCVPLPNPFDQPIEHVCEQPLCAEDELHCKVPGPPREQQPQDCTFEFDDLAVTVAHALWAREPDLAATKAEAALDFTAGRLVGECKNAASAPASERPEWRPAAAIVVALAWTQREQPASTHANIGLGPAPARFGWVHLQALRESWRKRRPPPSRFPAPYKIRDGIKGRQGVCLFSFALGHVEAVLDDERQFGAAVYGIFLAIEGRGGTDFGGT
jgi:hypothetical protein